MLLLPLGSLTKRLPTKELKTYLMGQLSRALAFHEIDEVIVYDEQPSQSDIAQSLFACHLLQYIESPPYLRSSLFKLHDNLKYCGSLFHQSL